MRTGNMHCMVLRYNRKEDTKSSKVLSCLSLGELLQKREREVERETGKYVSDVSFLSSSHLSELPCCDRCDFCCGGGGGGGSW